MSRQNIPLSVMTININPITPVNIAVVDAEESVIIITECVENVMSTSVLKLLESNKICLTAVSRLLSVIKVFKAVIGNTIDIVDCSNKSGVS